MRFSIIIINLLFSALAASAHTPHSWHVFPSVNTEGSRPGGDGSLGNPWDLQTAIKGGSKGKEILPGDTIWVHADKAGNTYWGYWAYDEQKRYRPYTYYSELNGTKNAPIIVKAWPQSSPGDNHPVIDCTRLMGGDNFKALCESTGAEKSNGKYAMPTSLYADMLCIMGSYTWIWGLEIKGSDPHREDFKEMGAALKGGAGINILSRGSGNTRGVKVINCVVHDIDGIGIASWATTENPEVYGNIIYYNGTKVSQPGVKMKRVGNGVYAQNADICTDDSLHRPSRSVYRHNFIFENYNNNFHINSSGKMPKMDGFTIDGNVAFNSGLISDSFGNMDYMQYSGEIQKDYIIINNHFCYFSDYLTTDLFASGKEVSTYTLDNRIEDNHFIVSVGKNTPWWITGPASVSFENVTGTSFRRNFVRNMQMAVVLRNKNAFDNENYPGTMTLSSDSNVYVSDSLYRGEVSSIMVFNQFCDKIHKETAYSLEGNNKKAGAYRAPWRKTTLQDMHSTEIHGIKNPAVKQLEIFKTANAYDPGRMHLVIYNWSNRLSAPLDMDTIIPKGSPYRIRDVQNYYGPDIAAGTYQGSFNLPLSNTKVAQPVGYGDKSNRYLTKIKHTNDMEYAGDKYMFNTLVADYFPYTLQIKASGMLCSKENKNEIRLKLNCYDAKGRPAHKAGIVLQKKWTRNGKIINDADTDELRVTTAATYEVTVTYENGLSRSEKIVVEDCKTVKP